MDLVGLALPCAEVVSLALAPFWALAMVWESPLRGGRRFAAWLGMCVSFCMMWTLPLNALSATLLYPELPGRWAVPVLGLVSPVLGVRVAAVHRRRSAGEDAGDPRLALACLALGAVVALLLAPTGASPHLTYAVVVTVAMATQAWLLLPPNLVTRIGACAALFGIVAAPLLMRATGAFAP